MEINLNKLRKGDYVEGIGSVGIGDNVSVAGTVVSIDTVKKCVTVRTGSNLFNILRFADINKHKRS